MPSPDNTLELQAQVIVLRQPETTNELTEQLMQLQRPVAIMLSEELQIKLQYSSFSPLQLWIKDSTGKSIYVGDLTFDSEGKVVLPILLFTMLGQKELLLIKSEDSDKLQNTQQQIGRLIINVVAD